MGWGAIKLFIDTAGEAIQPDRERALLSVAYDLVADRSVLAALTVADVSILAARTGRALIRRSKTDQSEESASAYLTRDTVRWLTLWISAPKVNEGPIFRRIVRGGEMGPPLAPVAIGEIFKRVAAFMGLEPKDAAAVSGQSIRVGAIQDLLAPNIDLGSVMQAGRGKCNRMPMRYGESILAARGGIARAAEEQGGDAVVTIPTSNNRPGSPEPNRLSS